MATILSQAAIYLPSLLLQIAVHRQTIGIMNNHKREFNRSDNTQSSIHRQLNTLQRQQPQPAYQRPNNTRLTTTPTTAAVLFTATAAAYGHNNTNDDNTIFNCNGGDNHQPPQKETRSTRSRVSGRRKRSSKPSSTPPPSISVSTNTSSSKKIKCKHHNKDASTSTSIVPNLLDSRYRLGTLSPNSKVSKSKPNYDTIKSLASSVSSVSSFNIFEEDADSIVSQTVVGSRTLSSKVLYNGGDDNSTNASSEEDDDEEEVDLEDETEGIDNLLSSTKGKLQQVVDPIDQPKGVWKDGFDNVITKPASYSCAPEDWNTNRDYHPANVEIWKRWRRICRVLRVVPTLNGRPIDPSLVCGPHLNWSLKPTDPFGILILRYCTTRIAGVIKGRHPAAAMNSNGECIAATWELLRLSTKKAFPLMAKMNFWLFSFAYRGSPYNTYSKDDLDNKIMPLWKELVMEVFQMDGVKTQLCSQGVMRDIEKHFFDGSNEQERMLQFRKFFLKHIDQFFSLLPHQLKVPNHPECLLNDLIKKLWANGLQSMTTEHDEAYTADQQWVLGDGTVICTAGRDIFMKDYSKASFQLALRACADALVRAQVASAKYKKQRTQLIDKILNTSDPVAKTAAVCKLTEALRVKSGTQVKRRPDVISRLLGLCAVHLDESIISSMSKELCVSPILNTSGLMRTLSSKIFASSSIDLDDTSSAEEVTAVIEKLVSSPGSDEASIALTNLIKNNKSVLMNLPALSAKLLSLYRGSVARSLMSTLSGAIFGVNTGLSDTSSAEEVTAVLEKLKSSPSSDKEASVAFNKLIENNMTILMHLPALSVKLLNIHKGGITRSLTNELSSAMFESPSNDLGDNSSAEDVRAVLEKLKSSPGSDDEASVTFNKLIKHKPTLLNELPELANKLLSKRRGGTTRSLTNKLSSAIFESSSNDLGDTSSAEDVKAVLEKLNSSPDSNDEASVVFDKLKLHKQSVSSQLPGLSIKLLSIHRDRVEAANHKEEKLVEKAQTQAANRQALLSAQWMMEILRSKHYTRQDVVAVPGLLGIGLDNMPGSGLLYVSSVGDGSQLKDKVSENDIIFCLDKQYIYNTSSQYVKKILQSKQENATRVLEVWRKVS